MASLLRQIVAGPRSKHAETGLDLCYVTPNIIATSGPSQTYPQRAYRNPLDQLVAFLDARHGDNWAIWEFRAEGTGYPDAAVHHRIRHYPWPDHHPPPFRLVPLILASMRQWLGDAGDGEGADKDDPQRVVVVHCKAGKGRSGTVACSYLVAACGWSVQQALDRFTARRMRPRFGAGVTIPSQLRWLAYVDRWTRHGRPSSSSSGSSKGPLPPYRDRPVEIVEIRVWGLRHGVKLAVEGYVDEGRRIRVFHTFQNDERVVVEGNAPGSGGFLDLVADMASPAATPPPGAAAAGSASASSSTLPEAGSSSSSSSPDPLPRPENDTPLHQRQQSFRFAALDEPGGQAVLFRPKTPVRVPTSDVNIALERRNRTASGLLGGAGLAMVTAVAHVWFNVFFEGNGPEQGGQPDRSGVFAIAWDQLDGIKGSSQKGSRAAERLEVVWRVVDDGEEEEGKGDAMQAPGASPSSAAAASPVVPQMQPADWKGNNREDPGANTHLGLNVEGPADEDSSQASSGLHGAAAGADGDTDTDTLAGVKASGPGGGELEEGSAAGGAPSAPSPLASSS